MEHSQASRLEASIIRYGGAKREWQSTEESHVGGAKSEDFRSCEKTMGESESGSEKSRELETPTAGWRVEVEHSGCFRLSSLNAVVFHSR
jgi:hypothetical protein